MIPKLLGSDILPPSICVFPKWSKPFKKVPLVSITAFACISTPSKVFTPVTSPSFITNSTTVSCQISKFGVSVKIFTHSSIKRFLSLWLRGLHIAGPLLRLSIRNWIALLSVTIPICPPIASISLTIWPLAIPPTAGLQLIWPILFISIVMSNVLLPIRAAALAASQPACPAPTTIISYLNSI